MSATESRLSYARSRAGNGHLFGRSVDRRSSWARRMRDLLADHIGDLGGNDVVTTAERSILRRVATISTELELLEAKFADGDGAKPEDLALYITAANSLNRLLGAIGLQRRPRDVESLKTYLDRTQQQPAQQAQDDIIDVEAIE